MTQVTDRASIADELLGRLAELDELKAGFIDKQSAVEAMQKQADQAAAEYSTKIDELLESGWATVGALAAQGHSAPRRRSVTRRKTTPEDNKTWTGPTPSADRRGDQELSEG